MPQIPNVSFWSNLLPFVPLGTVLLLAGVLRWSAHLSALAGLAVTMLLTAASGAFAISAAQLGGVLLAALLLVANAAWVMLPGVMLNDALQERGTPAALAGWLRRLPLPASDKAALVVVGIAPAIEAMTGFGVSLFVTVPVLLALAAPGVALRQAMLSVNIMPWGTLALATMIGAAQAGMPLAELGLASACVSAGVFPLLGAMAAALMRAGWLAALRGAALGAVFSALLIGGNALGWVEVAGVLAGLGSTALVLALAALRARAATLAAPPWRALAPYGLALGLIAITRGALAAGLLNLDFAGIRAGAIGFNPLVSPGWVLLATALLLRRGRLGRQRLLAAARQTRRALLALGGFACMAQWMAASGMVAAIGQQVAGLGQTGALLAAPALGMLGGYLSGSNTGANALLMPLQTALNTQLALPAGLLAAVQNSSAGHAVFASLPNIVLVVGIAGAALPPSSALDRQAEAALLRFGAGMALAVYLALLAGAHGLAWVIAH